MKKNTKIIIGVLVLGVGLIAFLSMCYLMYKKNASLSRQHLVKAERLLYANKTPEAVGELEKALAINPRNDDAEMKLFDIYMKNSEYKQAESMLQSQIKRAPDDFSNYVRRNKLAHVFITTNRITDAKKIYESMLPKYSQGSGVYLGLSTCFEKEGDIAKALEYQEKAITIMRNNPKFTPKAKLKKELQKLVELYSRSGQDDLVNKTNQEIVNIK